MRRMVAAFAVLFFAVPAVGYAQEELEDKLEVSLQGGIGGFSGGAADQTTNVGPYYGVMGTYNQSDNLAFEAGYQGITNGFSDPSTGRLSANRLQANVRGNLPLEGPVAWRPYAFAGLALDYMAASLENTFGYNTSLQAEVPVGLGADFFTESWLRVGARGTFIWNPGIGGSASVDNQHPSSWQAGVSASAAF